MGENRGSLGSADEPRVGPWALEAMPGETGFSAIAAGALSTAQAPGSDFERARSVRPVMARREEAAGSAPARTSHEASAGCAIRVRRGLTQKVRPEKGE